MFLAENHVLSGKFPGDAHAITANLRTVKMLRPLPSSCCGQLVKDVARGITVIAQHNFRKATPGWLRLTVVCETKRTRVL